MKKIKKVLTTSGFVMDQETVRKLREMAEEQDRSLSYIVRQAINQAYDARKSAITADQK